MLMQLALSLDITYLLRFVGQVLGNSMSNQHRSKTSPSPKWFIFGMVIGHGEKKNFVKFFYFSVKRFSRYGSLNFDRYGQNRDGQAMVKCLYLSFYGT